MLLALSLTTSHSLICVSFFFIDTATTEIYTLSLHDALPILRKRCMYPAHTTSSTPRACSHSARSEEHTSELQSPYDLVCRLQLEKKKKQPQLPPPQRPKNNDPINHQIRNDT